MYEIRVETLFSASHILNEHPGPCSNLHGHNWIVEAFFVSEKIDANGMVVDFAEIKAELKRITSNLDHKHLNEIPPFDKENPTAENIARWIYDELAKNLPVKPSRVTIHETPSSSASYF